jgi:hypothetical protein
MPRCSSSKPDGTPCERIVGASQSYCYAHDPTRSEDRRRAASKAGKSKPSRELIKLQEHFEELAEQVLSGEVKRGDAAVVAQLLNGARACVRDRLKALEQEELIGRLEHLEEVMEANKRARYS